MTDTTTSELSERELEILKLLATGASNKDIAQRLVISPNTVKVHLRNIFAKIGVVSRTEATLYALQHGMSSLEVIQNNPNRGIDDISGAANLTSSQEKSIINQGLFGGLFSIANPVENQGFEQPHLNWTRISIFIIAVIGLLGLAALGLRSIFTNPVQPVTDQTNVNTQLLARWGTGAPLPEAVQGLAIVAYEDHIYAIGGTTAQAVSARVDQYTPSQNAWKEMSSKPIPVTDISAAILGEKIYIPGGKLADSKPTDVVEVFDPRHNTWERTASLPVPISAYALATFEGKLYLFGGWDGKKFLSSVYEYDPERDLWQARTPMVSPRAFAGAAVVDSKIFVIGGYNGVKALALNDAYYPERDQDGEVPWETHAPLPQGRYAMGVTSLVDTIYVVGGNKEANGQNEEYSPQTDRWVAFENSPAKVGSGAGLAAFENKLYILGGSLSGEFVAMNQTYQAIYTVVLPFTQK